jgi:hypothetical protein
MALAVILVLYFSIGLLAAAGSVFIARQLFSGRAEQIFFALFLIPIAGFYLAFTAYFGDAGAWRFETTGVMVFTALGLVGVGPLLRRGSFRVNSEADGAGGSGQPRVERCHGCRPRRRRQREME